MKKYVAVIEMTSWMGTHQHIVKGDSASELLSEFEEIQSLNCLVRMGRMEENASGQKQLDKLEVILEKKMNGELTIAELKKMNIKLSIGSIQCMEVFEGEMIEERLKIRFPNAK